MYILTFEIEEWFHLLDCNSTKIVNNWNSFECRIQPNMNRILDLLDNSNKKATFFCLGWIAKKYPSIIKDVINRGHEIGSHGFLHQLVYTQSPITFKNDIQDSIKILEDISGVKIKYYRAPGFSITEKVKWAFEVLAECGIEVDCSIFPASRPHGGFPGFLSNAPTIIDYNGIQIKEMPINTKSFFGNSIVFSGGGYFRLFPYPLIKNWTKNSEYINTYFHPRDFDVNQPRIQGLSSIRKFRSYYGLKSAEKKFIKYINEFDFYNLSAALEQINWAHVKKVIL